MYDFTSIIPRRNTDSVKWDVKPNELPMWVADMDFKVAPEILDAMRKKKSILGFLVTRSPMTIILTLLPAGTPRNTMPLLKKRLAISVHRCGADDFLIRSPRDQCWR